MEKKNQVPKYPLLRFSEFTDEWKEVKLGEVLSFEVGYPFSSDAFNEEGNGVRLIKNRDLKADDRVVFYGGEYDAQYIVQNGDILIGMDGDFSPCLWKKGKALLNQRVGRVNANQNTSRVFILYVLVDSLKKIEHKTSSTTVKHLSHKDVEKIKASLPSLAEQKKIAALLSLIDERIKVQNAIIKEQEVAKTLLSKELLTPEDDWTEYAVQDCLTYEQPAKYIVKHTDYSSDSTLTPVLTANKGFILGYTSEQGIYQKGACIIFDDFTLDCKYVPFAFKVKSSAIKILQARKGFDIRFMFEVIKSLSLSPFAHKRHYISEVEPIKVLVPSLAKQERISRLFAALDERLDVERAYAERLKQQKAYLLRQMFI